MPSSQVVINSALAALAVALLLLVGYSGSLGVNPSPEVVSVLLEWALPLTVPFASLIVLLSSEVERSVSTLLMVLGIMFAGGLNGAAAGAAVIPLLRCVVGKQQQPLGWLHLVTATALAVLFVHLDMEHGATVVEALPEYALWEAQLVIMMAAGPSPIRRGICSLFVIAFWVWDGMPVPMGFSLLSAVTAGPPEDALEQFYPNALAGVLAFAALSKIYGWLTTATARGGKTGAAKGDGKPRRR